MKTISVTIAVFLLIGGLIIFWSFHQRAGLVKPQVSNILIFNDESFEKDVVEASKKRIILVDFYNDHCFPCWIQDPILHEIAKELESCVTIGKINTDKNIIWRKFGITKIPTLYIVKDGEIKKAFHGVVPKETLEKEIKELCS